MSDTRITMHSPELKINTFYNRLEADFPSEDMGEKLIKMRNNAKHGLLITIEPFSNQVIDKQIKMMWVLCRKIADVMCKSAQVDDVQVYRKAIEQVGKFQDLDVPNDELQERARMWAKAHKGNFSEELYSKKEGGKTKVRQYFGASTYNTKQMQIILFYLLDIAKKHDIDVSDRALKALLHDKK